MIELKLTKTRLNDYLRVFRLVLGVCDKFIITNDIIQPVEITDDLITGGHRVRHPLFPVTTGKVFESVPNIREILNDIRDKKGVKNISIYNDDNELSVKLDEFEVYVLATSNYTTDSTQIFDDIIEKYNLDQNINQYSRETLLKARLGEVVTISSETYGSVRLSKNCFPFIGASRGDDVNFSGNFSFGVYNTELQENYIASYMNYKNCDAFHIYVYVPFN